MGIKAVVEAIHEPPQEGELDGITLGLPWEDEARIRKLCTLSAKPLTIVGQIFTDLIADKDEKSKVLYKRHPQSFYLSSLEVVFAAILQLQNPCSSSLSPNGIFASRFVTAVLSGTETGGVDISAYQVSEQACAMVDADLIEPSLEPGIMRVKDEDYASNPNRYVPDVFFRYKNEYGRDVQKSAKPAFPVEYLLINVCLRPRFTYEALIPEHLGHSWISQKSFPDVPVKRISYRKPAWFGGCKQYNIV
jgi:nuclear protein localization family protein 4